MSEHTKLPWYVSESVDIKHCPDSYITTCNGSYGKSVMSFDEDCANAEYIVLACNAFEDIFEGISLIVEKKHYSQLEAQAKSQPDLLAACEISEACFRKLAGVSMLSSSKDVLLDNANLIKAATEKACPNG